MTAWRATERTAEVSHPADDQCSPQPTAHSPFTVLTTEQLAVWLQVSPRHVELMNLPSLMGLGRSKRYLAGAVMAHLTGVADAASLERPWVADPQAEVPGRTADPARYRNRRPTGR